MHPTKELPSGYIERYSLDLTKDRRTLFWLNVGAFLLVICFGWLFYRAAIFFQPDYKADDLFSFLSGFSLLSVLFSLILMVLLHEGIHGFFFWFFTREMPVFGYKGSYAFAAAPDWYLPRNQYLIVGSAPFVLLTLVGLIIMSFSPLPAFPVLLTVLTLNAAGAFGDMYVVAKVISFPPGALVKDVGDGFTVYGL